MIHCRFATLSRYSGCHAQKPRPRHFERLRPKGLRVEIPTACNDFSTRRENAAVHSSVTRRTLWPLNPKSGKTGVSGPLK